MKIPRGPRTVSPETQEVDYYQVMESLIIRGETPSVHVRPFEGIVSLCFLIWLGISAPPVSFATH